MPQSRLSSRAEIRVLDLFSGAGGLSEGLKRASAMRDARQVYSTVRAVEFDLAAAATYEANHGKGKVFAGAIEDWLLIEEVPSADLIIGGPPCQGFSALGKMDINDTRNRLWEYYAETIVKAQPKFFVLENVPRFLKSPQFAEFQAMCGRDGALRDYTFEARILNAAEYGAAQIRKRVILIGHHRDLPSPDFPVIEQRFENPANWRTVRKALANIPEEVRHQDLPVREHEFADRILAGTYQTHELHLTRRYEEISLKRFSFIKEGENRFMLPDHLKSDCWLKHTSGSGDVMGRLWWDRPSVTIRTEFFKPEKGRYLHPSQPRALTHQEAARIQGFRDTYKWVGSKLSIARQIGNAVPIPLGKAIGRHLLPAFEAA
jgi:DNA (cytosine-5)-methyltransferase 1